MGGGVVSDFEERVIAERLKLLRKKSDKIEQCDTITSSSPNHGVEETASPEVPQVDPIPPVESEEEKAERKLREKELEIQKLDEKKKRELLKNKSEKISAVDSSIVNKDAEKNNY